MQATSRSTPVPSRTPQRRRTSSSSWLRSARGGWAHSCIGWRLLINSEPISENTPSPTLVNKARSLRSSAPVFLGILRLLAPVNPHELPVILLSRFDDAFPGSAPRAEGCNERVVLAPEHHDVGVRLV